MRKYENALTETEKKDLNDFFIYFKIGFRFEKFVKSFFESFGFSITITIKKFCNSGEDSFVTGNGCTETLDADYAKNSNEDDRYLLVNHFLLKECRKKEEFWEK